MKQQYQANTMHKFAPTVQHFTHQDDHLLRFTNLFRWMGFFDYEYILTNANSHFISFVFVNKERFEKLVNEKSNDQIFQSVMSKIKTQDMGNNSINVMIDV